MKKLFLLIISFIICNSSLAQIGVQYGKLIDGKWSNYTMTYFYKNYGYGYGGAEGLFLFPHGSLDNFIITNSNGGTLISVSVDDMIVPTQKVLRKNRNKDFWRTVTGEISYYTDAETLVKEFPNIATNKKPELKKQTRKVSIKYCVRAFTKRWGSVVYNIFFEDGSNLGLGLELDFVPLSTFQNDGDKLLL